MTNEAGLVIEWNRAQEQITGVPRTLAVGKPIWEAQFYNSLPEEQNESRHAQVCALITQALTTKEAPWFYQAIARDIQRPDGTRRTIESIAYPIHTEQSFLIGSLTRDITERKQAEEALQRTEARWRSLILAAPIRVTMVDRVGTILFINRTRPDRTVESTVGSSVFAYLPADVEALTRQMLEAVWTTGQPQIYDVQLPRPDGSTVWYENRLSPVEQDGAVTAVLFISLDITNRKLAEERLAAERSLLRTLVDHLPDAIYVKDAAGHKTMANPADLRCTGAASEADLLGKTDDEFYPPEVAAAFTADDKQVFQSGQPILNREEPTTWADGTRGWQLTSKVPLRNNTGEVIGLVGIGHDITARKQAEAERERLQAQLVQAQKMEVVGRLAGGIAHDFNNMLAVILMRTELAARLVEPATPLQRHLAEIEKATRRSAELTSQLLGFARKQTAAPKRWT